MDAENTAVFRPLRRKKQALDEQACQQILSQEKRATLSLIGDEGYPYGVPVNFVYYEGKIYIHSARAGHKVDALTQNDKACFTVWNQGDQEENDWWYHVYSLICFGRIHIVEDEDLKRASLQALGKKYFPAGMRDIDYEIERDWDRVLMLELSIEHISGKHVKEE